MHVDWGPQFGIQKALVAFHFRQGLQQCMLLLAMLTVIMLAEGSTTHKGHWLKGQSQQGMPCNIGVEQQGGAYRLS